MKRAVLACLLAVAFSAGARADVAPKPRVDAHGIRCHPVETEYQGDGAEIRVLLPDKMEAGKRYPVVFVLPVEAKSESRFGNGLLEIKKQGLHNKFGVICVEIIFSHLPWYADHATDRKIRQETYILKVVIPFLEKYYPVKTTRAGRLLLGFSKSGWGAFSLLLRHPEIFAKAAAWDAPLMMAMPNKYGMADIFGTQDNFEKYQISRLLDARAKTLGKDSRLALMGFANFQDHHKDAHALMDRLGIAHEYRDVKTPPHTWHSGWVEPSMRWLVTGK